MTSYGPGHDVHRDGLCTGCGRDIGLRNAAGELVAMEIHRPHTIPTRVMAIAPSVWRVSSERTCLIREHLFDAAA